MTEAWPQGWLDHLGQTFLLPAPMPYLSPNGPHVRSSLGRVVIVAYQDDDDVGQQAVLGLLDHGAWKATAHNYCTFVRMADGSVEGLTLWMNIHDASNHMQQYMGCDR